MKLKSLHESRSRAIYLVPVYQGEKSSVCTWLVFNPLLRFVWTAVMDNMTWGDREWRNLPIIPRAHLVQFCPLWKLWSTIPHISNESPSAVPFHTAYRLVLFLTFFFTLAVITSRLCIVVFLIFDLSLSLSLSLSLWTNSWFSLV